MGWRHLGGRHPTSTTFPTEFQHRPARQIHTAARELERKKMERKVKINVGRLLAATGLFTPLWTDPDPALSRVSSTGSFFLLGGDHTENPVRPDAA